jgi:hypothetical protein
MSLYSVGNTPYSPEFFNALPPTGEQPSAGLGAYGSLAVGGDGITNVWPSYGGGAQTGSVAQRSAFGSDRFSQNQNAGFWNSISSLIAGFGSLINNSLASIGNSLGVFGGNSYGNSYGTPTALSPSPGVAGDPSFGVPNQQGFTSASFHSVGDPHDAFAGTSSSGTSVNGAWDDKHSHGNLISSDSFAGGVRVSSVTTPPIDSKGTRYNESATITSNDGRTQITYNKDGSFYVSTNGQNVSLTAGKPTSLGNGETATLNADGSLAVNFDNGNGGTLAITLAQSDGGKGVNVTGTGNDVDLGGYLVGRSENAGYRNEPTSPLPTLPQSSFPASSFPQAPLPLTFPNGGFAPITGIDPGTVDPLLSSEANDPTVEPAILTLPDATATTPVSSATVAPTAIPNAGTTGVGAPGAGATSDPFAKFAWLDHVYG